MNCADLLDTLYYLIIKWSSTAEIILPLFSQRHQCNKKLTREEMSNYSNPRLHLHYTYNMPTNHRSAGNPHGIMLFSYIYIHMSMRWMSSCIQSLGDDCGYLPLQLFSDIWTQGLSVNWKACHSVSAHLFSPLCRLETHTALPSFTCGYCKV